jgi:multiple sugar transport system ATP-binding protein
MGEVVLKNVSKSYGQVEAVKDLSFEVREEQCVTLLGPSGAGKTSTLKMIAGLEEITAGEIFIDGRLANYLDPHERDVAMTFESYALYPHMTVYDNMALPLRSPVHKTPEDEIKERVIHAATMLGIDPLLDRMPAQLSQGQKQRVGLGRTLVRRPSVFLFDEPLSHVDAKVRHRMRMEIKRIQEELKTTSIYVTHDYLEALALGDWVVVINEGVLQQRGTPQKIFHEPVNEFVQAIVGDPPANFLDARIGSLDGDMLLQIEGGNCYLPVPPKIREKLAGREDPKVKLAIRPMYVTPSLVERPTCQVKGSVYVFERIETKGVLDVRVGDVVVLAETEPDFQSEPDQPVWLEIDLDRMRVYDPETTMAIAP